MTTNYNVNLLLDFYNTNLRLPRKNKANLNEITLYNYMQDIKKCVVILSKEDYLLLEEIGIYVYKIKFRIHEKVLLLIEFYKSFNRWPYQKEKYQSINLGNFMHSIKTKNTSVNESDKELLQKYNFPFETNKRDKNLIHEKVLLLVEFYNLYKKWPNNNEKYKGQNIGNFVRNIKVKDTHLSNSDKELLENLNFKFEYTPHKDTCHEKVLLLEEFYILYGRWPIYSEIYKNVRIGVFYWSIKAKKTKLYGDDYHLLQKYNFEFKHMTRKEVKQYKLHMLIEYFKTYNKWPKSTIIYKGVNIGSFSKNIRNKGIKLSDSDTELLKSLGFNFECISKRKNIHNKVLLLIEYYNTYHKWPNQKEIYKGEKLGIFINCIRTGNTKLSEDEIELLKSIDFCFKVRKKVKSRS